MRQLNIPDDIWEVRQLRFAAWLRKQCHLGRLTAYRLADYIEELGQSTIQNHLNGTYFPSYDSMVCYFEYFGVSDENNRRAYMYEVFRQVEEKYKRLKRIEDREREKLINEIL